MQIRGKVIDNAVNRLNGVNSMQRGKNKVTCFGGGDSGLYGFKVAHLADEDNIGALAENVPQRFVEVLCIESNLALIDDSKIIRMQKLNRVFDGDYVAAAGIVDMVYHGGKGGGLAATGGARHENKPAAFVGQRLNRYGKIKLIKGKIRMCDITKDKPYAASLQKDVDAEPS